MTDWFWKKLSFLAGLAATFALFAFVIFSANIEMKDLDLWLHLATGKYILQHQIIPQVDIFSCTIAGAPWINHEWLFQVIVYFLYSLWGIDGLSYLQIALVTLTFLFLLWLGYNKEKQLGPIFILLLVLLVYQTRLTFRPDLFSFLFLVLYIYILALKLGERSSLWLLLILQILWSNIHGFFIIGPVLIGLGFISEWIKRHIRMPFEWNSVGRLTDEEYTNLKQAFFIVLLACLVNPYGLRGALYPFNVLFSISGKSKLFFSVIGELQKPIAFNFSSIFSISPYSEFRYLIILSLGSFVLNYRRFDVGAFLLWLVFLCFSLNAVRNLVFFAIIAYLVFIINTQSFSFEKILPARLKNFKLRCFGSIVAKCILAAWILNQISLYALSGYYDFDKFERKSEYGGISLRNFPQKAVDFLVVNRVSGNFFNDFNSGAYLVGRVSPRIKVFIDGRTELYGPDFFEKYQKIWMGDSKAFDDAVEEYHLTGFFLNSVRVSAPIDTIKHLYARQDWVLVYFDYDAAIFLRDIPENKEWIDRFRIDLSKWQAPKMDLMRLGVTSVTPYQHMSRGQTLFNLNFFDQAKEEAQEVLRIEPTNVKAYKLLGKINLEKKEYEAAFENLRKAKLLDSSDMEIRYNLAVSLYYLKNLKLAREQCDRVLADNRKNAKTLYLLALINANEKEYEKSIELFKEAQQISPKLIDDILKIGDLLFDQNEFGRAKEVYKLALEAGAQLDYVHQKLGECYQELGQIDLAQTEFKKAQESKEVNKNNPYKL